MIERRHRCIHNNRSTELCGLNKVCVKWRLAEERGAASGAHVGSCLMHLFQQRLCLFLSPAKLRSQKQGEGVAWGVGGTYLAGSSNGSRSPWKELLGGGGSKWTCQMPQTGSRKLLLNDVKFKRLFQVRQKLTDFVVPCMLTWWVPLNEVTKTTTD